MFKILKNLSQTWKSVLIIIMLLCVQAWADLELPNFTSKIVNVGIQQGGIETSYPEVMDIGTMDNILLFTKDDEKILDKYTLKVPSSLKNMPLKKYIGESEQILYVLNDLTDEEKEELSNLVSKPLMILSTINNEETAQAMKEQIINSMNNMAPMDNLQKLPKGVDPNTAQINYQTPSQMHNLQQMSLMEILKSMPEEQLDNMLSKVEEGIDGMNESILEQAAVNAVKQEYKTIGINTDKLQNNYIFMTGLQMLGIAFISMICAIGMMFLANRVGANLGRNLRDKIFRKVLSFSNKEFREFSTASLITRSTNDIQQIQNLIGMMFRTVVYAPIIGVGGFVRVLTGADTSMAWIIGLAIIIIVFLVLVLFIVAMPKFRKLQDLVDKLNLVSREILSGIPVIRAFNTQKREEARFDDANKELMKANLFVNKAMSIMMPGLMLVMNGITILIVWVGGKNVDNGELQVGDMMAFIQYTMQIVISFLMISMISIMLPRASVSAKRINEVLDKEPSIKNKENLKEFDDAKKGLVEFKNVSFRYPDADEEILTDISFTAKPGETTAIIGSTGSGKSTIVNLLPRFYDVTRGELLIDGVNIKDVSIKSLREKIGFVPQKGVLFSGTIESNIKYGNKNIDENAMIKAAQIAQAEEFIETKENKYQAEIAQGGNNVSGGQKQRLSIARALAVNPEILVFDDSFSALDLKTDSKLRDALAKEEKGKTIIVVAQRISTIMNAEQIIVLEEGKIVGKGTHEELMKNCDTYKQIALSQLSEDELK